MLHAKRAAMFSRAQTKAFNLREGGSTEAERDGDDNETVLAQIASFLRQMPAETMNQPESRKPIDDLVAKVKTLASMIHIDTGRPLVSASSHGDPGRKEEPVDLKMIAFCATSCTARLGAMALWGATGDTDAPNQMAVLPARNRERAY